MRPLTICIGAIALFVWVSYSHQRESLGQPGAFDTTSAPLASPRGPLIDEDVAVSADGWQSRGFTLSSAAHVHVFAEGFEHASSGFTVYVMDSSQLDNFQNHRDFIHIPALQCLESLRCSEDATLPAGSWTVVVHNSENFLMTMAVRLRVVVDP